MMRRLPEAGLLPFMLLLFILPFSGTVALRLLCLAAAFAYTMYAWKRLSVPRIPFIPVLIFWAAVALFSVFYAIDPDYSLSEIKNEVIYTMMAFVAFFAITSDYWRLKWLFIALISGAFVMCISALGIRVYLGEWTESSAYFFGGSGAFPGYLFLVAPLVCLFGFLSDDRRLRKLSLVLLGLLFLTGYFCLQRIIWPVLFVQLAFGLILYGKQLGLSPKRIVGMLLIVAMAAYLTLLLTQATRFKHMTTPKSEMSKDDRLFFWPKVTARILETPLTGAGFGRRVMSKAYPDLVPADNPMLWHAHNVVLDYGLSMGVPGMMAILLLFGALLREYVRFWRSGDRRLMMIGACGIVLLLGVFLRHMVNDIFVRDHALLFWAINGMLLGIGCRQRLQLG